MQRFILDSYITGSVVYEQIRYQGKSVFRGLPSTLDVLFALGNDAVLPLLREELERYHYAANLAGLRYLVDSYQEDFWKETFYNGWLDAIRALNPPQNRSQLPPFMRTDEEWWLTYDREPSFRPDFVKAYLADAEGMWMGETAGLSTAIEEADADVLPSDPGISLSPGYPNPFNAGTIIRFAVGPALAHEQATLVVYNAQGQVVKRLVDPAPARRPLQRPLGWHDRRRDTGFQRGLHLPADSGNAAADGQSESGEVTSRHSNRLVDDLPGSHINRINCGLFPRTRAD